jgi:hypothetical protein
MTKHTSKPVLPAEQLQQIGTFLDQNPPTPLTNDQAGMVNKTLNKKVELDDADIQAINSFVQ